MSNLNGPITALLAVIVVAFGGALCLLAGGKTGRARDLILVLFVATFLPLTILEKFVVRNYYAFLTTSAIVLLLYPLCLVGLIVSTWLEWASPSSAWQSQDYRLRSRLTGIVLPICTVALAVMMLPKITDYLLDIADGPTQETAIVETASRNNKRLSGGTLVIKGVSYQTWDETLWENSLNSPGQAIEYVYGPNSKIAFLPELTTFEPASVVIPLIVLCVGCALASLFVRMLFPRTPISRPPGHNGNPSQQAVEALIVHFSSEKPISGRSDRVLPLILLIPLLLGMLVIILNQLSTR